MLHLPFTYLKNGSLSLHKALCLRIQKGKTPKTSCFGRQEKAPKHPKIFKNVGFHLTFDPPTTPSSGALGLAVVSVDPNIRQEVVQNPPGRVHHACGELTEEAKTGKHLKRTEGKRWQTGQDREKLLQTEKRLLEKWMWNDVDPNLASLHGKFRGETNIIDLPRAFF